MRPGRFELDEILSNWALAVELGSQVFFARLHPESGLDLEKSFPIDPYADAEAWARLAFSRREG